MEPLEPIQPVEEPAEEPIFGGYDFVFVDELSPGQICSICLVAMRNPVQTPCGHRFCEECLVGTFGYCVLFNLHVPQLLYKAIDYWPRIQQRKDCLEKTKPKRSPTVDDRNKRNRFVASCCYRRRRVMIVRMAYVRRHHMGKDNSVKKRNGFNEESASSDL